MLNSSLLVDMNLIPRGWGDQQGKFEALIANLNANGVINCRTVDRVYEFYGPIDTVLLGCSRSGTLSSLCDRDSPVPLLTGPD